MTPTKQEPWVAPRAIPFAPPTREEIERWQDCAPAYAVATIAGTHWHPTVETTLQELQRIGVHVERLVGCSDVVQARSVVATTLLDRNKSTAILWLDADTTLHPADCLRLLDRCQHWGAVAAGCLLTAVSPSRGRRSLLPVWGEHVHSVSLGTGPTPVAIRAAGMGCAAHPIGLLDEMTSELSRVKQGWFPFFMPRIDPSGYYLAEDFSFWEFARALGWDTLADPSIRVIHWGEYPYHWEDAVNAWGERQIHESITVEFERP
jgi:hypothetical protein